MKHGKPSCILSVAVITSWDTFLLDTSGSGILNLNGYSIIPATISNNSTLTDEEDFIIIEIFKQIWSVELFWNLVREIYGRLPRCSFRQRKVECCRTIQKYKSSMFVRNLIVIKIE